MSHIPIPRHVQEDASVSTDVFTMAHAITSTPHPIGKVDSIGVMPGLGEDVRLTAAISAWEANPNVNHLLVAGTNPAERTQPTMDFLRAEPINLRRTNQVRTQVTAEHTRGQALWLLDEAYDLGTTSMGLFVSHWHMTRAYSTVIKAMLEKSDAREPIPIFPFSVATAPNTIIPEVGVTASDMSKGEAVRIMKYQAIGHVATLPELNTYLTWLWEQSVVPIK